MKTISKIFGAFAAVALLAACGSEETFELTEGQVPAGMKQVTLTVSQEQGQHNQISMNNTNGNLTWSATDDIAVVYSNGEIYRFAIVPESAGTNESNFIGYVPVSVYENSYPTDVYSNFVEGFQQGDYEEVSTVQENIANTNEGFLLNSNLDNDSNLKGIHLHGVVEGGTTSMPFITANLSLDHAAIVRFSRSAVADAIVGNKLTVHVGSIGSNEAPVEYTIHNATSTYVMFFVKVGESGLQDAHITVEGSDVTFHTGYDETTHFAKTIQAGKRYGLSSSVYAVAYDKDNNRVGSFWDNAEDCYETTWGEASNLHTGYNLVIGSYVLVDTDTYLYDGESKVEGTALLSASNGKKLSVKVEGN